MPADCYRVDVIHYLNPSLIWVEVCDSSLTGDDFAFEQIGIYGIVPFETTIDSETASVVALKCTDWVPATKTILKNLLFKSSEVWFLPTHIDRRSTIFDDNIHKYGELIIKSCDGKLKKVSKHLVHSGFAELNVCQFHKKLSNGELNTELDHIKTQDVIRQLEKHYSKSAQKKEMEKLVKKQTSVFRLKQDFESELTVSNLEKHNNIMIRKVIENKINDFELCKDQDEKPLGRAFRRIKQVKNEPKSNFMKKKSASSHEQKTSFDDIKRFLEINSKAKDSYSDCSENTSVQKNHTNSTENIQSRRIRQLNNLQKKCSRNVPKNNCSESVMAVKEESKKNICTEDVSVYVKFKRPAKQPKIYDKDLFVNDDDIHMDSCKNGHTISRKDFTNFQNTEGNDVSTKDVKEREKSPKPRQFIKTNEQNCNLKKLVAFGPPGLNPINLKVNESSIIDTTEKDIVKKVVDKEEIERHRLYGEEDSEVQIEITNKKSLNDLIKTTVQNCDSQKNRSKVTSDSDVTLNSTLQRRLRVHKISKYSDSSLSSSDTCNRDTSSVGENKESFDDDEVLDRIDKKYSDVQIRKVVNGVDEVEVKLKNNVNPFKNIDSAISVFVDKLVTPILMVHTKMNKRIEPVFEIRDVYFNSHIRIVLRNMAIEKLMMLQTVTWSTILRGYSLFMVSPMGSGKTMGYLPAVCRLVSDGGNDVGNSVGPMCIVVCATAKSVTEIERLAKMLLGLKERVLACYAGVDTTYMTTALLNGCDMLICTPPALARLLQLTDFGVDLRRLSIFVLEDCERLAKTYSDELKFFQIRINAMLKVRVNKELKVQYIIASRVWCDFMEPLAKKAPDTVICIGAFQECVLYSKACTSVSIIKSEKKLDHVFEFLNTIDTSKKTVIVCETNNEVELLEKALRDSEYVVFASDNNMTVHDLYNLSESWGDYQEPVLGPILVCCDGNLTHMNIADAHYLIHFSLPQLFSMFCKRFAVLNDNYPSIFKAENENIKIKIILEENNVQQLPKIVNFIKRCTDNLPPFLDEICAKILTEKDSLKAENYVPLCDNLLTLGVCPDFYNCQERHTILKDYDTPKEWVPLSGIITFKIIHYHTAALYSARLLTASVNDNIIKFPQTYSTLSLKMGMFFGKESNRKLHGMPEIGDICAVAMKLNFFARCQVLKVLNRYQRGNPNKVLVKLIDEEKYEITRDIYLYYLPDELKEIETRVVQIRLANVEPKDKDITFSDLARCHLKKITDSEEELFMKAQVSLALGNCIFVTILEACQELSSLNETIVKCNFKHELLLNHAITNLDHMSKIEKLCYESGVSLKREAKFDEAKVKDMPIKNLPKGSWAYLESEKMSVIFFASAINPEKFFIRLDKFESCMSILLKDIKTYVENYTNEACDAKEGDIVLAKFPDDATYERARIDNIDGNRVKCFFVDQGDWREVQTDCLLPITEQFINRLPFQAIECRLVGVMPPGKEWTDFSTNWFCDTCYEDNNGELKRLYANFFTKESAEFTNGYKYGVVLIDTNSEQDIVINELMIDLNLARENEREIKYFENLLAKPKEHKEPSQADNQVWEQISDQKSTSRNEVLKHSPNTLLQKPLRSMSLVDSDFESDDSDKWDVNINADTAAEMFYRVKKDKIVVPTIKEKIPNIFPDLNISTTTKRKEMQDLDSDDLTSPESTEMLKTPEKQNTAIESDQKRRPKIIWRQNKNTVHAKIQLVVDTYELKIDDRMIDFTAFANDTKYEFDFELFGVVNKDKSNHINKGRYILVKLCKVLNKNWLTLTRDGGIKKWIVYDVDFIDTSSDEEVIDNSSFINIVKNIHDNEDSESDDDFYDDAKFSYKKH